MPRIRLSPSASITPTEVGVLLRSDLGMFQLHGSDVHFFVNAMVPLLDGSCDKEAVADVLRQYSRESVMAFLDLLEQHGLLEPIPDEPRDERWRAQDAFFRKWTERPEELTRRLREARVLIVGLEPWGVVAASELATSGIGTLHLIDDGHVVPDDLISARILNAEQVGRPRREALAETLAEATPWCGITTDSVPGRDDSGFATEGTWDLIIGALAGDELLLLRRIAGFAHRANVTSLYGHLEGLDALVGPVVVPGQTACWNCARLRLLANADHQEAAHALHTSLLSDRRTPRMRTYLAPMAPLLGHLLALEAVKIVSRYTPSHLAGRLLVQNLVTLETTLHTLIRMPWCEICGGAASAEASDGGDVGEGGGASTDAALSSRNLNPLSDATELRSMLAGWLDPRTGIINQLLVPTPDATEPELPVTSSAILASYTEGTYVPSERKVGSGKGLTPVEAMIGAVGEAIERYSASRYRKADLQRAALDDLAEDRLDPRQMCLYEDAQYDQPNFPFARFDPGRPIEWIKGRWLGTGGAVWLPALLTYFDFHASPDERFCQVTSNGLAAGAGLEDATLRAVLELVERDAFMITWLAQRPAHRLILDDTLEPGVREVVRQLQDRGVEVELFLLDVGLSIPTVMCLGIGDGKRWPGVTVALGAHLSPHTASRRAILEQGHVGPYISGLMRNGEHALPADPKDVRTLIDHALYYAPAHREHEFRFLRKGSGNAIPLWDLKTSGETSLAACVRQLQAAGIRVAVADVTSPDIARSAWRVVRALGVDMQPIDFGVGLQRQASPRLLTMLAKGQDLNRHPHPFA
jgi:ribosomal protein S12 methylthiotransferase accessory factor